MIDNYFEFHDHVNIWFSKDCSEITDAHWKNFHPSKENQVELLIKHLGLEELDTIKEEVESGPF